MALTPGTRIGSYEIAALIGVGGMGEVYRARDTRLGRDVALKVLPAGVASDAERLARFEREARAVAALNHPNIVTLHSIEDEAGVRYLTMELVEGQGLDAHVTPGGLPIERVLDVGWTALAAANSRAAMRSFRRAVQAYEEVGSPRGTGLALLGIAAVEAADGRSERAVAIAAAAQSLSARAGVVVEHPMDPGVVERIEALKASIPKGTLDGLVAEASTLTPSAVLAMVAEQDDWGPAR